MREGACLRQQAPLDVKERALSEKKGNRWEIKLEKVNEREVEK